jgi:hypothetical protein
MATLDVATYVSGQLEIATEPKLAAAVAHNTASAHVHIARERIFSAVPEVRVFKNALLNSPLLDKHLPGTCKTIFP